MKVSKKAVRFEIGAWRQDDEIHITATNPKVKSLVKSFHSTVNKKEGSKRRHPNLYDKLDSVLKANGK